MRWLLALTAALLSPVSALSAVCDDHHVRTHCDTQIGVFLDGTWNSRADDTLVSKLHDLYQGHRTYIPGVGTNWFSKLLGGAFGLGGRARVEHAADEIEAFIAQQGPGVRVHIDITGYSRGGAQATSLAAELARRGVTASPNVELRFLTLLDPVGSFGWPGNRIDIGHDLELKRDAARHVHVAAAAHERNFGFELRSPERHPGEALPKGWTMKWYPGGHGELAFDQPYRPPVPARSVTLRSGPKGHRRRVGRPAVPEKRPGIARVVLNEVYEQWDAAGVQLRDIEADPARFAAPAELRRLITDFRATDPARRSRAEAELRRHWVHEKASDAALEKARKIFYARDVVPAPPAPSEQRGGVDIDLRIDPEDFVGDLPGGR